jgi:hypothetical protein
MGPDAGAAARTRPNSSPAAGAPSRDLGLQLLLERAQKTIRYGARKQRLVVNVKRWKLPLPMPAGCRTLPRPDRPRRCRPASPRAGAASRPEQPRPPSAAPSRLGLIERKRDKRRIRKEATGRDKEERKKEETKWK